MSIGNKTKFLLLPVVFLICCSISASALSIRLLEGGVPVMNPQKLVDEGIRQGNTELLRQAWKHYESSMKLSKGEEAGYLELG